MTQDISTTLVERGSRYGDFYTHAKITQTIKDVYKHTKNWEDLPDDMKEALDMVAHKIGRILNGDPYFHDSWHDIVGYVKLVADKLLVDEKSPEPTTLDQQIQFIWGIPMDGPIDDE